MFSSEFATIILLGMNLILHSQCRYQDSNCPDEWTRCGDTCFFASTEKVAWHFAPGECQLIKNDSYLLILDDKKKDENIRKCLQQQSAPAYMLNVPTCDMNSRQEVAEQLWIDGIFNEKEERWVFGATTLPLQYQAFSRRHAHDDSPFKCIALNRQVLYRWSSMDCFLNKNFICEIR